MGSVRGHDFVEWPFVPARVLLDSEQDFVSLASPTGGGSDGAEAVDEDAIMQRYLIESKQTCVADFRMARRLVISHAVQSASLYCI